MWNHFFLLAPAFVAQEIPSLVADSVVSLFLCLWMSEALAPGGIPDASSRQEARYVWYIGGEDLVGFTRPKHVFSQY